MQHATCVMHNKLVILDHASYTSIASLTNISTNCTSLITRGLSMKYSTTSMGTRSERELRNHLITWMALCATIPFPRTALVKLPTTASTKSLPDAADSALILLNSGTMSKAFTLLVSTGRLEKSSSTGSSRAMILWILAELKTWTFTRMTTMRTNTHFMIYSQIIIPDSYLLLCQRKRSH